MQRGDPRAAALGMVGDDDEVLRGDPGQRLLAGEGASVDSDEEADAAEGLVAVVSADAEPTTCTRVWRGLGSTLAAGSGFLSEAYFFGLSNEAGLEALKIYAGAGRQGFNPCEGLPDNPINFTVAGPAGWFIGIANAADALNSVFAMGAHFAGKPPAYEVDPSSRYVVAYDVLKPEVVEAAEGERRRLLADTSAAPERAASPAEAPSSCCQLRCCSCLTAFGVYHKIIGPIGVVLASTSSLTGAAALSKGAAGWVWDANLVAGGGAGTVGQTVMYALSTNWAEPVELAAKAGEVYRGISAQPWHIQASFYLRSFANIGFRGLSFGYAGQALPGAINTFALHYTGEGLMSGPGLLAFEGAAALAAGWGGAHMGFLAALREAKGLAKQKPRPVDCSVSGIAAAALDFYIGPGWRPRGRPTPGRVAAYALFLLTAVARTVDMNGQVYSLLSAGASADPGACGGDVKVVLDGVSALASTIISTALAGAAAQRQAYYMGGVAEALDTGLGIFAYPSDYGVSEPDAGDMVDLSDAAIKDRLNDGQVQALFTERELEPQGLYDTLWWLTCGGFGGWRVNAERLAEGRSQVEAAKTAAPALAVGLAGHGAAGATAHGVLPADPDRDGMIP